MAVSSRVVAFLDMHQIVFFVDVHTLDANKINHLLDYWL